MPRASRLQDRRRQDHHGLRDKSEGNRTEGRRFLREFRAVLHDGLHLVAFAIADVDRDGVPEVIVSEASAPGTQDSAKVITLGNAKPGAPRKIA